METYSGELPFEDQTNDKMAPTDFDQLSQEEVAAYSAAFKNALTPPGHMEMDKANKYMAEIVTLFALPEMDVRIAVGGWAVLHDVGAVQSFAGKPPIVCGTKVVQAEKVFGEIVPVTAAGEPRQFCAAVFERHIDKILQIFPQINTMLAARCAKAGLPVSNPKAVISFLKGVTPATMGTNVVRNGAKGMLLARSAAGAKGSGASNVAHEVAQANVTEIMAPSGHNLWN